MASLARREMAPISMLNVREWFPSPRMENALAGEPWWVVQSVGLLAAIQLLKHVPPGPEQQQALIELRRSIDTALLVLPEPPKADIDRRLRQTLAPWAPSSTAVVAAMLDLAELKKGEQLVDLGSGDGRIVFAAGARGANAVGVEIDAKLVAECRAKKFDGQFGSEVVFLCGDLMDANLEAAHVVTCYLLTSSMEALEQKFRQLRHGTRIISHAFAIAGWKPARWVQVDGVPIFCWVV